MKNGFFKYYRTKVLIGLISLLSIALFFLKDFLEVSLPLIGSIGIMLFIIDKYLWNKKIFSWMFWIDDFSGRYEGSLVYEYRNENCETVEGSLEHVKIIHQTGSEIKIYSFTRSKDGNNSSESEDEGVYVEQLEGKGQYQLKYSYQNKGKQDLAPHYGTDIIKIISRHGKKVLNGRYYTERLPFKTKGRYVELKWVSGNQEHEF